MNVGRTGLLHVGDRVQLTDDKGRKHTVAADGRKAVPHPQGRDRARRVDRPARGDRRRQHRRHPVRRLPAAAVGLRALHAARRDGRLSRRTPPRSSAFADIFPGARVLEAGAGSGALTCSLLRAVGDTGRVISYERRADFAEIAARNVELFFGGPHPAWECRVGDVGIRGRRRARRCPRSIGSCSTCSRRGRCCRPSPQALIPGGVLCGYVATTTQLSRLVEAVRESAAYAEPFAWETMMRGWHVDGLAVRPDHRMVGHTGFLVTARRLAPGVSPRRVAPGRPRGPGRSRLRKQPGRRRRIRPSGRR